MSMCEQIKKFLKQVQRIPYLLSDFYHNYMLGTVPKYQDDKRLSKFGYKVYSQYDEDGLIQEILKRINVETGFFVEFGVGDGLENNTTYLLLQGWKGVWIEGNKKYCQKIDKKFKAEIDAGALSTRNAFITAESIVPLFGKMRVPTEFDLLSIDVDGNDYWIWEALQDYRPKIVVIEYNASFRSHCRWVMKYNPSHEWRRTNYFGASLKSLELLGSKLGYKLVGCCFGGMNAFFVREDLIADKFASPFTAENHYEPARYFINFQSGQPADYGDFKAK
jgi:hypothetical protein